jgi:hypothetical protein
MINGVTAAAGVAGPRRDPSVVVGCGAGGAGATVTGVTGVTTTVAGIVGAADGIVGPRITTMVFGGWVGRGCVNGWEGAASATNVGAPTGCVGGVVSEPGTGSRRAIPGAAFFVLWAIAGRAIQRPTAANAGRVSATRRKLIRIPEKLTPLVSCARG